MAKYSKAFAAFVVMLITGSTTTMHLWPSEAPDQNVTLIHKTDPYWPVKGAFSVEPCQYRHCTDV